MNGVIVGSARELAPLPCHIASPGIVACGVISTTVDRYKRQSLPVSLISQMGLIPHVIPLAFQQSMVLPCEIVVNFHAVNHALHPPIRTISVHLCIDDVLRATNLNVHEIATCKHYPVQVGKRQASTRMEALC